VEFSRKKLPQAEGGKLRLCRIESVQPFVAMPAPVYVFLRANEKFVAVKAPLDFFTPEELARLRPMESFFFPEFIDRVQAYRDAGRRVRAILKWSAEDRAFEREPAPYEISDAVIRVVGRLWSARETQVASIESFFVSIFAAELCDPMNGELVSSVRDRDVSAYERQIIVSSWVAFLALHLGYCDLDFLASLRSAVFAGEVGDQFPAELVELVHVLEQELRATSFKLLSSSNFANRPELVAARLSGRMGRIQSTLIDPLFEGATIYGETGFIDG
jgi:hypothetical protein